MARAVGGQSRATGLAPLLYRYFAMPATLGSKAVGTLLLLRGSALIKARVMGPQEVAATLHSEKPCALGARGWEGYQ